jgi:hypothetical protein
MGRIRMIGVLDWVLAAVFLWYFGTGVAIGAYLDDEEYLGFWREMRNAFEWGLLWLPVCMLVGIVTLAEAKSDREKNVE